MSRLLKQVILILALVWLLVLPVAAQIQSTAPITLDGRRLFRVSDSGGYTAQERAEDVNRILKETVRRAEPPIPVEIVDSNNLPVIQVNGRYLLTVTGLDAPPGVTVEDQANTWAALLSNAIKNAQQERTGAYLRNAVFLSIGAVVLAIACSFGIGWIWQHWLRPRLPTEATDTSEQEQQTGVETGVQFLIAIVRIALWVACTLYVTNLFPHTRELSRSITDILGFTFTSPMVPLGETSYSLIQIVFLLGLFVGLFIFAKTVKKLLRSRVLLFTGLNRGAQETVAQIANYALLFIGTLILLQLWGLDLSSLAIFASVLGVGIGLGLQGIAREFVSGLVIIFERPIQVGDFVEVDDVMGTVERISIRSTQIFTIDQLAIIIPNSRFLESNVINWSYPSPVSRLQIPVTVAYGSPLEAVREALLEAAKEHPDVVTQPSPRVFFTGYGENALNFKLLVWVREPRKQFQIKSDLYFAIDTVLRDRHIETPVPQRDLHIRTGTLPVELSPELQNSLVQLSDSLSRWLRRDRSS